VTSRLRADTTRFPDSATGYSRQQLDLARASGFDAVMVKPNRGRWSQRLSSAPSTAILLGQPSNLPLCVAASAAIVPRDAGCEPAEHREAECTCQRIPTQNALIVIAIAQHSDVVMVCRVMASR
jgi:hypothetical protein